MSTSRAIGLIVLISILAFSAAGENSVTEYDVVWDSPSHDSSGSMPLGNGDIGLNAWVEEDGDLLFYISKTDAWDENGRLVKVGKIRAKLTPGPGFEKTGPLKQRLNLHDGVIEISAGEAGQAVTAKLWVDANNPVVRLDVKSAQPVELEVRTEVWRKTSRALDKAELSSAYGLEEAPHPVVVRPDFTVPNKENRVIWCHQNEKSIWLETLELQGMKEWAGKAKDPLMDRIFGALIDSDDLKKTGKDTAHSEQAKNEFHVNIAVLTAQAPSMDDWRHQLEARLDAAVGRTVSPPEVAGSPDARANSPRHEEQSWDTAFEKHCAWWHAFWDRSSIEVSGTPDAEVVSRGYALQRFVTACAGRGAFPIKFNGSIFTVDAREPNKQFDADYRAWGGPYWFQNTRLIYWPMLAAGDFEVMQPLFQMYSTVLPFAQARTRLYLGHEGAFFPETMYFWGAYANDNYGWNREGKKVSDVDNRYIRWHWEGQIELVAMLLDAYAFTQNRDLATTYLLPLADAVTTFFARHYTRNEAGKLVMKPAQALETWQNVVDPLPDIAGLHWIVNGLLALPSSVTSATERDNWQQLKDALPPVPMREVAGQKMLAPAQEILADAANSENPELYAVFPFRLYGVTKPDLAIARATFENRRVKDNHGWRQDDTQAALLGLTDTARQCVAERFTTKHAGSRFPAFWGPNFDWIPDQDHGCNGEMALQAMLCQTEGRQIFLFPAWPKEWNVKFKLHAPFNTTVEGVYADGKVRSVIVTPPERQQDLIILNVDH